MNIEELIIETFKKAVKMEDRNVEMENNNETKPAENIRIIYPCYNDKTKRFSEQEIKQLFIQTLIENNDNLYFSVETPTKFGYAKFSTNAPEVFENKQKEDKSVKKVFKDKQVRFRSASLDLCVYCQNNKYEFIRKHLIEFKAKNTDEKDIKKDFLKLFVEDGKLHNYFIHILDSADSGTLKKASKEPLGTETKISVLQKYYNSWKYCTDSSIYKHDKYPSKNTIIVYLFIIENKTIKEKNQVVGKYPSGYYKITLTPNELTPNLLNPLTENDWKPIQLK